jgi:hypothetical protein
MSDRCREHKARACRTCDNPTPQKFSEHGRIAGYGLGQNSYPTMAQLKHLVDEYYAEQGIEHAEGASLVVGPLVGGKRQYGWYLQIPYEAVTSDE